MQDGVAHVEGDVYTLLGTTQASEAIKLKLKLDLIVRLRPPKKH